MITDANGAKPSGTEVPPLDDAAFAATLAAINGDSAPEFSEDAIALEFTRRYPMLRYTAEWCRWSMWDGHMWQRDSTLGVFDTVRKVCREIAAESDKPALAAAISKASTVAAVERLARSDRIHAATVEQWDANEHVLNTPKGVVDLRTGSIRPGVPDDYITRSTAVAPNSSSSSPLWTAFLARVTGDDIEIQRFLQRVAGYCLTGDVSAHAMFFLHGSGGNGKGVFLNTLTSILADYAKIAPIETFTAAKGERHPTELAGLRGARLVASQETEEGRAWAESKLKSLVSGDPIAARFMRGDFFTFKPTFKIVIAGNNKPRLRNVDEAIRRRLHLIPFTQTIAEHERDEALEEKLRAEWPAILAWAIDGAVVRYRDGLQPPQVVRDATFEYLTAEDSLATWIDECCVTSRVAWGSCAELYRSWHRWAEDSNETPGSSRAFGDRLQQRGYERSRAPNTTRGHSGIALRSLALLDDREWRA